MRPANLLTAMKRTIEQLAAFHELAKALTSTLDEILDYEAVAATMSAHTEDAREGTMAFVEKRKPEFKGR